jgi:hypothetical protein
MLVVIEMLLERQKMAYRAKVFGLSSAGGIDLPCEKKAQLQIPTLEEANGDVVAGRLRSIIFEVETLLKVIEENDPVMYQDFDARLKKVILAINLLRRAVQERKCLLRIRRGIQERRFA